MKKISKIFLIALAFSLLAVTLGFLTSSQAPAQATSTPVTVVNGTANPVPTTAVGTTPVSGSVAASQRGPWLVRAAQASPWSVSNPINASNAPVPLIVQADGEPFTVDTFCGTLPNGTPTPCEPAFPGQPNITLPTGSSAFAGAVVIDFVSGYCSGLETSTIPTFPLQVFGLPNINNPAGQTNVGQFFFPGVPLTGSSLNPGAPGSNNSWFAQQTKIYGQPGSSVVLLMGVNTFCSLSVSGHLIP